MRFQTARIFQYFQGKGDTPIQPTDILAFEDELKEIKAKEDEAIKSVTQEQSDKLNDIYEKYINRRI